MAFAIPFMNIKFKSQFPVQRQSFLPSGNVTRENKTESIERWEDGVDNKRDKVGERIRLNRSKREARRKTKKISQAKSEFSFNMLCLFGTIREKNAEECIQGFPNFNGYIENLVCNFQLPTKVQSRSSFFNRTPFGQGPPSKFSKKYLFRRIVFLTPICLTHFENFHFFV